MIYQWVYSYSCWNRQKRPTDVRSRGFGTFSWTEGLSIDEIDELERRCSGYNFPSDYNIPARPTQEEIDEYLPVAFYSFTLASGKRAIVRTRYVGEGFYDKRWGAIISHGLILDEGDWPTYAMEYFDSPVFWNELPSATRDEAVQYKDRPDAPQPPYLPALEINELQMSGKYSPEHVAQRLEESPDFSRLLASLIQGFMTTNTESEPLCISAPTKEIPWLFAGLMMAFPVEISDDFSFCTYLSDKMPAESEVGRWYRVAAVEKRSCFLDLESSGESQGTWYVDTLFKARKPFMEFLQDFSALGFGDMPCAVKLYRYLKESDPLGDEDFSRSLKLLVEHGNEDVRREFLSALVSGRGLPQEITDAWFASVFALAADYEELRPICYDLFLQHRKNYRGDELAFFERLADKYPREITIRWLEEDASSDLSTNGLLFTFASLQKNGNAHELGEGPWEAVFKGEAASADWTKILGKIVSDYPDCVVPVICKCPNQEAKAAALNKICGDVGKTVDFVERLIAAGQTKMAIEAIRSILARSDSAAIETLRRIVSALEKSNASFIGAEYGNMIGALRIKGQKVTKDDFAWLLKKIDWIKDSEREAYLKSITSGIEFPRTKDPEYRSILSNFLLTESGAAFRSGRVGLIEWFLGLMSDGVTYGSVSAAIDGLAAVREALASLPTVEQLVVCEYLIAAVVGKTDNDAYEASVDQQSKILSFIAAIEDGETLDRIAKQYVSAVSQGMKRGRISYADVRMLALIKCAIGDIGNHRLADALLEAFSGGVLRKMDESDLNHVKQKIGTLTAGEKKRWDEVCEMVAEGHTFLSRMKSVTGLFFKRRT